MRRAEMTTRSLATHFERPVLTTLVSKQAGSPCVRQTVESREVLPSLLLLPLVLSKLGSNQGEGFMWLRKHLFVVIIATMGGQKRGGTALVLSEWTKSSLERRVQGQRLNMLLPHRSHRQ